MSKLEVEVLNRGTSWLGGKECENCENKVKKTVEFMFNDSYFNICLPCFDESYKEEVEDGKK